MSNHSLLEARRWTILFAGIPLLLSVAFHPLLAAPAVPNKTNLKLPDTNAGRCAAAYFEVFNLGDDARMRDYLAKFYSESDLEDASVDERLGQYHGLRERWGDLTPVRVSQSTDLQITLLVLATKDKSGIVFRVKLEEDLPHPIEFLTKSGITLPADGVAGVTDELVTSVADRARPIDVEIRNDTVELVAKALRDRYVYPEIGANMADSLVRYNDSGRYNEITKARDLAEKLTEDLFAVSSDRHLAVEAGEPVPEHADTQEVQRNNYHISKGELLPGNIGYVKIDYFHDMEGAKQAAAAALASVADCGALIFDLRDHAGGGGEVGTLILSYFFSRPTLVSTLYDRNGGKVEEFRTLDEIPGKRFSPNLPVYVLTSDFTGSAAEGFAYALRHLTDATIVGETTQGMAHPYEQIAVNDFFWMWMPFLRPENAVTHDNWEGVGITPDIQVPASNALDKALEDAEKRH